MIVTRDERGDWTILSDGGVETFAHGHHDAVEVLPIVARDFLGGAHVAWHQMEDGGFFAVLDEEG